MFAISAASIHPDAPLEGLFLGEHADPEPPEGWAVVNVKAAALNHHDLWTLRGVGIKPEQLPIILGCDAAGIADDGSEVIVHAVIGDPAAGGGDETLDPRRSLLSEIHNGTLGARVWVTSREEGKRAKAVELGADAAFESGARLPERVDLVIETVGAATWDHSLKSLRPGGRIVVSGATSGAAPSADLNRVFFLQLSVIGSTMGTRDELAALVALCADAGVRPLIDSEFSLRDGVSAFERLATGEAFGKIVLTV